MTADTQTLTALTELAAIAHKLASTWHAESEPPDPRLLFDAIQRFSQSWHSARPTGRPIERFGTMVPARFEEAIWIMDPGVYDVALLARAMLRACEEIANEAGDPTADPAIRLIASQLAWVCNASPNLKAGAHLSWECTRRTLGR